MGVSVDQDGPEASPRTSALADVDKTVLLVRVATSLLIWLAVGVLLFDTSSDATTAAADWIPAVVLAVVAASIGLVAAHDQSLGKWRSPVWLYTLGFSLASAVWVLTEARGETSAVVWSSTAVLFTLAGVVSVLGRRVLQAQSRPRGPARTSRPWDISTYFPDLKHWETPSRETGNEISRREVQEFETIAWRRADLQRRRFWWWQLAQYGIGLPAALFAGAAGATGLTGLTGNWRIALGILGLVGAGLTSVSTALNAGKHAEEASVLSHQYETIAQECHVYWTTAPKEPETDHEFLTKLVSRMSALTSSSTAADKR